MENHPYKAYNVFVLLTLLFYTVACQNLPNPVETAETAEQKLFAMYGTFAAYEKQAAVLVTDVRIPVNVRRNMQKADAVIKPIADNALDAAVASVEIRAEFLAGETTEARMLQTAVNLQHWIDKLQPALAGLILSIEGAKGNL